MGDFKQEEKDLTNHETHVDGAGVFEHATRSWKKECLKSGKENLN